MPNQATSSRPRLSQIFRRRGGSASNSNSNSDSNPPSVIAKDTETNSTKVYSSPTASLLHPNSASNPTSPAPVSPSGSTSTSFFSRSSTPRSPKPQNIGAEDPLFKEEYHDQHALDTFREALREDVGQHLGNTIKDRERSNSEPLASDKLRATSKWKSLFGFNWFSNGVSTLEVDPDTHPTVTPTPITVQRHNQPNRISAASDFAPIRERTSKRKGNRVDSGSREGWVYNLLRFPLLLIIFLVIGLEFFAYVGTRQIVNVIEYLTSWRGRKGTLRSNLRKSKSHLEWKEAALKLDDYMGYSVWKSEDSSGLYDWVLIKKVLNSLKTFRENEEASNLLGVLDLCLRDNFAGTENFRLYSQTWFGTKNIIEEYLNEIERGLEFVEKSEEVGLEEKKSFYRSVSKNMGKSALCLSGGGSFGYYHVGVVKSLLDANLLPNIITGTSAGGLIAALTCTRTNEELSRLLVPALADRITACEESIKVWSKRVWKEGARFDTLQFAEKAQWFCRGSLTFMEAFKKTGKVLNISVIPSDKHSPSKLLNYLTAPDCIIWSALLASAAVPGIMNPVVLMQKTSAGITPWNWGHRFRDGSLRVDIPLKDLHSLYNVNFPLVSQVNPHVHLFFFAPKGMPGRPVAHRKGKGWRGGFILSAAEHVLKVHLSTNFKIMRDLDLLPSILGADWANVFLQPFSGAVTIWPKTRAWDWVRILSDPDRTELMRMIRVGEICTWPKVHMISNRIRLERAIERGRRINRSAIRALSSAQQNNNGSLPTTPAIGAGPVATPGGYLPSDTDAEDYMGGGRKSKRIGGDGKEMDPTQENKYVPSLASTASAEENEGENQRFGNNDLKIFTDRNQDSISKKSRSRRTSSSQSQVGSNSNGVAARLWKAATMSPTRRENRKGSNSHWRIASTAQDQDDDEGLRRSTEDEDRGDGRVGEDGGDLDDLETEKLTWSRGSMSAGAGLNIWEKDKAFDEDSDSEGE